MKTEKRNTKKKNQYQEKYRHPTSTSNVSTNISLRKKCPYLGYSGPHFPVFGLNTERYSVFSPSAGKCGPE